MAILCGKIFEDGIGPRKSADDDVGGGGKVGKTVVDEEILDEVGGGTFGKSANCLSATVGGPTLISGKMVLRLKLTYEDPPD
jgi:hypothetical protein